MSILMNSDVEAFFASAVDEAVAARDVQVSTGVRSYLTGLLAGFACKGPEQETLRRPVTLLLREALDAPPPERFEKLKSLGDGSLYVAGIFQEHLEAHGVDVGYVSSVGATAYRSASTMIQRGDRGDDLFGELSAKFHLLVRALREVADAFFAGSAVGPEGLLRVYARWEKTGSARLGRELIARGVVPVRGGGGLH
jgi:hypothetical protein